MPKTLSRLLIPTVVLLLGLAFSAALWLARQAPAEQTNQPLPVSLMTVEAASGFERALRFTGRVEPRRRASLAFEVPGRVDAMFVDDGESIAAGAELAALDDARLESALERQRAELADARATAALAGVTEQRQKELVEAGHVPPQAYDEARFAAEGARARVSSIEARIAATEIDLADTVLTAPFDAVVISRRIDEGAVIEAGIPVFDLEEDAAAEARIGIPARFLSRLPPGSRHRLIVGDSAVTGTVRRSVPQIDPATRSAPVVFDLPSSALMPSGELVTLELFETVDSPGFWLPMAALDRDLRGLWAALAVVPAGTSAGEAGVGETGAGDELMIERRSVEIIHFEADRAYVRGALAAGDRIVTGGTHRLVPGQAVVAAPDSLAVR